MRALPSISIFLLLLALPYSVQSQDAECRKPLETAKRQLRQDSIALAINNLLWVKVCDEALAQEANKLILEAFENIEKQKNKALKEESRAKSAEQSARIALDKAKRLSGYFNFSEAAAAWAYNVDSARFALIDADGIKLTPFIYENPEPFKNGAAMAQKNNQYVFLNESGIELIDPLDFIIETDRLVHFAGLVIKGDFGDVTDKKWVQLKKQNLSTNLAVWESYEKQGTGIIKIKLDGKWGWIDSTGNYIIKPLFENPDYAPPTFVQGRARVKLDSKWGWIDSTGNYIIKPLFDDVQDFVQGRARVKQDGKWGHVDSSGQVLLDFKYTEKKRVAYDCWRMEQNGRFGLYSPHFGISIPAEYEAIGFIGEEFGWIRAQRKGKWGWVDKQGKVMIPFRYTAASPFVNGRAEVWQEPYPKFFWINKKGEMILE